MTKCKDPNFPEERFQMQSSKNCKIYMYRVFFLGLFLSDLDKLDRHYDEQDR